jgi:hypothetical protein
MSNKPFANMKARKNDLVYTPLPVVKMAIEMCDITPEMTVLDPCRGAGVFYNNLPECKKDWCEITENVDFFERTERVDLIIGNPPFSIWNKWLEKTISLTDKFCYIMGVMNLTVARLNKLYKAGYGITRYKLIKIDWWFCNTIIVLFEKNKPSIIEIGPELIYCDICNMRCKRGRGGRPLNECAYIPK